uniref:Zinc-ribbon domain-containing protein n=1 Tax=viral metagenome TaxID=1070528 RepID=A0A6C0KTQ0_9ZZZZ
MNKRQLAYLEKAHTHALSKEGKCLSDTYDTIKVPLQWMCKDGHAWERNYEKTVHRGIWCTVCFNAERDRLGASVILQTETPDPDPAQQSPYIDFLDVIYYPFEIITQQYASKIIL